MQKLLFTICCICIFMTHIFSQNITAGAPQVVTQFVPKNFTDNFCLVQTNCHTLKEANQAAEKIQQAGGRIAVIGSPEFMIGWIPQGIRAEILQQKNISALFTKDFHSRNNSSAASETIIRYYNSVISGELFQNETEANQKFISPEHGCALNRSSENNEAYRSICEKNKNSEYLKGSVSCGVFFVESNGAVDPNTYTWTSANITNLKNQIIDAYSIWSYTASQNGVSVTFTPVWYQAPSAVISQPYEPILHPSSDDGLWITSILANLGYNSGDKFTDCNNYNWDLRNTNGTNWAYAAFIINNPSPAPTGFTDGRTSYAYREGPYAQLLLRASGWAISTFFRAFGHESGHIFGAFDEYSSSDPANCAYSFNGVVNTNYQGAPCNGTQQCVMIDNVYYGTGSTRQWYMCNPTKSHIGWQNMAPAPTLVSPPDNLGVNPGTITFTWNRNTANININSTIRVCDTLGNIMDCSVLGANNSAQVYLPTGVYKWQAINGTDMWDGGYAEVTSPIYTLYVGMNGITEADNNFSIEIFPNPASGQVIFQNLLPGVNEIEVYSIAGQKIFSDKVRQADKSSYEMNVSGFSAGFYTVSITNNGQKKLARLLIK